MRIIENRNDEVKQEYEIVCPHCNSKLAYYNTDIRDCYESAYIVCPCCQKDIDLDEIPTAETIQYPKDFFSYADGVPIKDDEINKWVKECANHLDDDSNISYSLRASGDTIVFAYKAENEPDTATVIVAKKYQETDVKISKKTLDKSID